MWTQQKRLKLNTKRKDTDKQYVSQGFIHHRPIRPSKNGRAHNQCITRNPYNSCRVEPPRKTASAELFDGINNKAF